MKTKATLLICLVTVTALASLANVHFAWSSPNILYVPSQYPTIQAAIDAAYPGDTIQVANGIYNESTLVIAKENLTLQGTNKATTIIDGQSKNRNIIIVNADNITIRNFTVRNAGSVVAYGVLLNYSKNAYLTNNIFSGSGYSIRGWFSRNITVRSSSFQGDSGGAGFYTWHCQSGLFENNVVTGDHVGAFIIHSSDFVIRNNTFSSCIYSGTTVSWSEHNWIVKNTFIANIDASLAVRYNGTNIAVGNTISSSKQGLMITTSPNNMSNTFYHNNFINNVKQVNFTDSPVSNTWQYTSGLIVEGNYWNDYSGADIDRNGIGESPYSIGTSNQDPYPLIGPFTEFTVASQTGPCNVYTISNSVISDFSYNQVAKKISFYGRGAAGSVGICRIVFPSGLVDPSTNGSYAVFVNGETIASYPTPGSSQVALFFNYVHGTQPLDIVIIPEFPTLMTLSLILPLTFLIAAFKRGKKIRWSKGLS